MEHGTPGYVDISLQEACASGAPAVNNLGGLGPDAEHAERIQYKHVAEVNDTPIDLSIKATSKYVATSAARLNGCAAPHGHFGRISLDAPKDLSNAVDLEFIFENATSMQPVTLRAFEITFIDLDTYKDGQHGHAAESITLDAHAYTSALTTHPSELRKSVEATPEGRTFATYAAHEFGYGLDNPTVGAPERTPMELTEKLRRRSVAFRFENVASFRVTLHVSEGHGARNFFFAGRTNLGSHCDDDAQQQHDDDEEAAEGEGEEPNEGGVREQSHHARHRKRAAHGTLQVWQ